MRYQDAVTDRNALDITNKTSKAYFNVSDWLRVYYNILNAHLLVKIILSPVVFDAVLEQPLITSLPSVSHFNTLLANLEEARFHVNDNLLNIPDTETEIISDWESGINKNAPTYIDVNLWEKTAKAIYMNIATAAGHSDWVTPTDPGTRRHRTNVGICGADLTRNNGFVRY